MLHQKDTIRACLYEDVYASTDATVAMPKYRMPEREHDPRHAYAIVRDELMLDGNSRMNLATFCQTWLDPEAHLLMNQALDKNMIDKDEYPQAAEIAARCVAMLADLWHAPHAGNTLGCSTTGSSEAAMLGGLAMKWRWRQRRASEGKPADKPNLICGPVQICWHEFARYFDVELREVPLAGDRLELTPETVVERCDENTIGVVPTLGITFTLRYEPARLRLVRVARGKRPTARLGVLRRLPRRQHADVRPQFLASCRAGRRSILQLPPAGKRRVSPRPSGVRRYREIHRDRGREARPVRHTVRRPGRRAGRVLDAEAERAFAGLHSLRFGRSLACPWLAGARLPVAGESARLGGPTRARAPRRQRDLAGLLLQDIKAAVEHFARHPTTSPLSPQEASGYHH